MKNQKGITLIALVVTIIVLLILAGVAIAMLTGDNGLLTNASGAKVTQIEAQVDEEVRLAVASAKIFAEQKAVSTAAGYLASAHLDDIKAEFEKDLTEAKGYLATNIVVNEAVEANPNAEPPVVASPANITIKYITDAYKQATNESGAYIQYTVKVVNNTFEITNIAYNPSH